MSTFIENQNWRYATKKFNSDKKISNSDLEILKEAIQLSSSSYGLQPYKVLIIENEEIRKQLQPASWGQSQITEASHLFVFASVTNVDAEYITRYAENMAKTRNIPFDSVKGYAEFMIGNIASLTPEKQIIWAQKQAYLALGNLLNAAAELKIDVTPMEGFLPEQYNEILGLKEKGLHATLVATIGYRHDEDETQHYAKVRKPITELFETI
ncbi:NAD(P)H-dependent oxidoreductase [Flavobacterium sp.]|uniref:NAD(P)H-dependent oxidoreductase n=1 Tax=Flavobacterium sp. TaxID=239 RepID=UPI001B76F27D|nr:NAD(P)H-dependent oxidoreductase [Flavobacterium sp.]MBP6127651.1 NAD(P)H-dependent oxidoreductase [Flavobacterium sp.]